MPRGGVRPGAGPKTKEPGGKVYSFYLYPSDVSRIKLFGKAFGYGSDAESLRAMILVATVADGTAKLMAAAQESESHE